MLFPVSILMLLSSSACRLHQYTKFGTNQLIRGGVMTSLRFSRWRSWRRKSTSGFGFGNVSHLRTLKSICIPNFSKLSQSTAEILLLPVSENKRPPYWNSTSGFNFDLPKLTTSPKTKPEVELRCHGRYLKNRYELRRG